jgi:hypothetical protein
MYPLDGVVVNSVTGEPVRAALVQILAGQQISVLTGPDGKFHFDGVPQSQLTITVRKPGFFSEQELSQGAVRNQMVQVGPNLTTVTLKLFPESVIYGRISDSDGALVENLPVRLMYAAIVNGEKQWQQQGGAQTNEDGEFRFFGLAPGIYYLKVGPSFNPRPSPGGRSQTRREGYPSTYYPGALDLDSAAEITVAPGKQIRADFNVTHEVLYQVSGTIVGYSRDAGLNIGFLNNDGEGFPVRVNDQSGAFVVPAVPAGSYVVRVFAQGKDGPQAFGSLPVNVKSDLAGVHVMFGPAITVPVAVRFELTRQAYPRSYPEERQPVNIQLIPTGAKFSIQRGWASMQGPPENQSFAIRNLERGSYRAEITSSGPWYVESARYGETNLLTQDLAVGSAGAVQLIEIVLRDDFATLDGTVSSDGHPAQGIVLLIPEFNRGGAVTILIGQKGQFQRGDLPPGEYKVFAFDRADGLEFSNSQAMRKYAPGEQLVRLAPNGRASVSLELQKRGD